MIGNIPRLFFVLCLMVSCTKGPTDPTPEPVPVAEVDVTPADNRWQITADLAGAPSGSWLKEGKCYATQGIGRGKSYLTAVSVSGFPLEFGSSSGLSITGLQTDDYILWCIPEKNLKAGTDIDFMLTIGVADKKAPTEWTFGYKDGTQWVEGRSFKTKYASSANHTSFVEHFSLNSDIQNDTLEIRCRVSEGGSPEGVTYLAPLNYEACRVLQYDNAEFPEVLDCKKTGALGNSFSYYYAPVWMLKEIARSQGHQMDLRMNVKGSQTFGNHLTLALSEDVVKEGGYEIFFLQDQSVKHSNYADKPESESSRQTLSDTKELVGNILSGSPGCRAILENTWSYPSSDHMGYGSAQAFDSALTEGAGAIASQAGLEISPICAAFASAREKGFQMYYTDDKHQSEYGAYLKACVNYLLIYGTAFTAEVSDCNLPPKAAAALRAIAEKTVLKQQSN